jgi:WD repeat-containing protein 19
MVRVISQLSAIQLDFVSDLLLIGVLQIADRNGRIIDEISLPSSSPILSLSWDKDGEYLAVLQEGNSVIPLWSLLHRSILPLETNLMNPTFIAWSKIGPQLAIGTTKGYLLIYKKEQETKPPPSPPSSPPSPLLLLRKHKKKIHCGEWSSRGENILVLGSYDQTISVSNEKGESLFQTQPNSTPFAAKFKQDENIVSATLEHNSLLLLNIWNKNEEPMLLTFTRASTSPSTSRPSCRYGEIVHYEWCDNNRLIFGFSHGWIIVVSTNLHEIGVEKYANQIHSQRLTTFSYNPLKKKVAIAGNDGVKVMLLVDMDNFQELKNETYLPNEKITQLGWSPDGEILTLSTGEEGSLTSLVMCHEANESVVIPPPRPRPGVDRAPQVSKGNSKSCCIS